MRFRALLAASCLVSTAGCYGRGEAENLQPFVAAAMSCCSGTTQPKPPSPDEGCGCDGRCQGGRYKADGTVSVECSPLCPCGCRKTKTAAACPKCLDTKATMDSTGRIKPCTSCCTSGTCTIQVTPR